MMILFILCGMVAADLPDVPTIEPTVPLQELADGYCWFHPRGAAIPGFGRDGAPRVVMTLQKHLRVSDYYSGLYMMVTEDLGATWTGPEEIEPLAWVREPNDVVIAVADVTPGWHAKSQKLIAIGAQVRYSKRGEQLEDKPRSNQTAYAIYDPVKKTWSKWAVLELPGDAKFNFARNACSQWLVEPDGTLLLPLYYGPSDHEPYAVTVARCAFDGQTLRYLEHGDELELKVVRGLCEPSLIKFKDRYYLTLRNDEKGYVTSGSDGLHFEPIRPWRFDDGTDLGSYNTQQHWLASSDALYLAYTRRGAGNDHIFRHRAPLFLAAVDPMTLTVRRSTEQVLIPERGAALGNFGAAAITAAEAWVTDAEFMNSTTPHPRGANGSVYVTKVKWR